MQNTIPKTSQYQTAGVIKYPLQIDPSTVYQFCPNEVSCRSNADFVENKYGNVPVYDLNVWNQVGNGIGTESFQNSPKTLQDKIELIHQQKVPYVTAQNAPPEPIPLSEIINNNTGKR